MITKNITKKDMAIKHGIQQQDVIARFNSKLVVKKNGCIELDSFAYDPRIDIVVYYHVSKSK